MNPPSPAVTDSTATEVNPNTPTSADILASADGPFPEMYWGVASGASVKALREACRSDSISDHDWTINLGDVPTPSRAEISYATKSRTLVFDGPEWFVDCGGYTELADSRGGTYSFDIAEYVKYIHDKLSDGIDIGYWALRDWPIDEQFLTEYGRSERTHQRWTVRDHIKSLEVATEYGLLEHGSCQPLPVIQGLDKNGYLWHLDYLNDHGLLMGDTVCVGSLKGNDIEEIKAIGSATRDALPSKYRLHGLGLTQRDLQHRGIRAVFDSTDTQSWNYGRSRLPDKYEHVKDTWIGYMRAYEAYLDTLQAQEATASGVRQTLADFNTQHDQKGHYSDPLRECVCGTTIDPNAIKDAHNDAIMTENTDDHDALTDRAGCRHCRRSILNLTIQELC